MVLQVGIPKCGCVRDTDTVGFFDLDCVSFIHESWPLSEKDRMAGGRATERDRIAKLE